MNEQAPHDQTSISEIADHGSEHLRSVRLPIFKIGDATICGCELLIRGPKEFNSVDMLFSASASEGLLTRVDRAALSVSLSVCRTIESAFRVHINLYPETILCADMSQLSDEIRKMQTERGGGKLCIELIEMASMPEPEELLRRIRLLKNACVEIAIDDVGYGASSVETLILLEPEVIKLDRRFVTGAYADPEKARRYNRLVRIAKSLDCITVAEGVDTEDDRAFASELGVDMGQGLLTGPLPK